MDSQVSEKFIIDFSKTIDMLVNKYSNYHNEEEIRTIAWLSAIKSIRKSVARGIIDPHQVNKRAYVMARSRIFNFLKKEYYTTPDGEKMKKVFFVEYVDGEQTDDNVNFVDSIILKNDIDILLTDKEKSMLNMIQDGYVKREICAVQNLSTVSHNYEKRLKNIKSKLKDYTK